MNHPSSPDTPAPHPASAAIEDAAIAWLSERDDRFSPAREREFVQWLRADPRHAAAVARLEQTLGLLGELPEFRAQLNTEFGRTAPVVPFSPSPVADARLARKRSRALAWSGLAAALALGAFVGARALWPAGETRYATTVAGYERARLADGSTLELNAASVARVRLTPTERRVELESGEAHFEVAHDEARPFVVSAGGVWVRAVGTAFNVRFAAEGGVEVTVIEGKVVVGEVERVAPNALSAGADADPARWGQRAPPRTTLLAANERLVLPKQAPAPVVEKVTPAALRSALAWQGRLVEFAEAPLAEVVARFNRRNRVQLVLDDPALGARRIGGTFALDEPEAFVRLLERDGEISAEPRGENELVLRRAR